MSSHHTPNRTDIVANHADAIVRLEKQASRERILTRTYGDLADEIAAIPSKGEAHDEAKKMLLDKAHKLRQTHADGVIVLNSHIERMRQEGAPV